MCRIKPLLAACAAALVSFSVFAEKTAKAVYKDNRQTLRFVYDESNYGTKGTDWFSVADAEAQSHTAFPPWHDAGETVTKVVFDYSFADYKPKHFSYWFWGFGRLTSVVGTECLDISESESFRSMFEDCSNLVSVDLGMCITGNAKATTMYRMFSGCSKLELVQLRGLCTDTVTDMQYMFMGCENLQQIYASDDFVTANANGNYMFGDCERLVGGNGTEYSSTYRNAERARIDRPGRPGYFIAEPCAKVVPSADGKTLRFTYDSADCGTRGTDWYSVAAACEIEHGTVKPWRNGYWNTATKVVIESNFYDFHPRTCDGWFYDFSQVTEFEGLRYLNVSEATTLTDLFRNCSAVRTLDLSTFNTAKATSIAAMFNGCSSLETIYASDKFTTSQISGIGSDTFYGCSSSLVGGNGTRYTGASGTSSGRYAHVDTDNNPGYFTLQTKTAKVVVESGGRVLRFVYDSEDYGTEGTHWFSVWKTEAMGSNYDPAWCTSSLRGSVTRVEFDESFAQYKPRHCSCWFNCFSSLSVVDGLENLDTSDAVSFAFMFGQCRMLSKLDLSSFDTRSLVNLKCMFAGCDRLTEVRLDHFTTDKVTCMNQVFSTCTSLATIYALADFSIDALPDSSCGFDMFEQCVSLVGANGTSWNGHRASCRYAKIDRQGTEGFLTLAPTAKAVPSADRKTLRFVYDNLDYGTKDTDWYSVDETCALPILTVPTWYDESFYATNVVIEKSFAEYRPTSCEDWFYHFSHVEEISGLRNLDVSRAVRLSGMFEGCTKLKVLDLSRFDTANAQSIAYMFNACTNLVTIYASDRFVISNLIYPGDRVFGGNLNLVGGNGTTYSDNYRNASYAHLDQPLNPGYFSVKPTAKAVLEDNATTLVFYYDTVDHYDDGPNFLLDEVGELDPDTRPGWSIGADTVTEVVFDPSFADYRVKHCGNWFALFTELEKIDGLMFLDVSEATDLRYMFQWCQSLRVIDLSGFDTSSVTNMHGMFHYCTGAKRIYVSSAFTTAALDNPNDMVFKLGSSIVTDNGTKWKSSNDSAAYARIDGGASAPGYFSVKQPAVAVYSLNGRRLSFYCDGLDHSNEGVVYSVLDTEDAPLVPRFDTQFPTWVSNYSVVTQVVFDASFAAYRPLNCAGWFYGFSEVESFEGLENLNTSGASSMAHMFNGCSKVKELDLSGFDTGHTIYTRYMFNGCAALTTIYASEAFDNLFDPDELQCSMFDGCVNLVGDRGTTYDANRVTFEYAILDGGANAPGYFSTKQIPPVAVYAAATKTLTFYCDGLDHSNEGVVYSVKASENLDENNSVPEWYDYKTGITNVVFDASFATYKPRSCRRWFYDFDRLKAVNGIENLDTSEVVDMKEMFMQCSVLETIDLSHFNTANVTNMNSMFSCCMVIETLDVSSFDTLKVCDMAEMFNNCWALTTIYAYDFSTVGVYGTDRGANMFTSSDRLVGGNGTRYSSDHVDYTYACIDLLATPGYFTYKAPAPAGGYAAWAAEQGLAGDDAAWDAKPSKWGGEWANAFIYTFGEGLVDGTINIIGISFDANGRPVITTAPVVAGHDDFSAAVIGAEDLRDWSSPVYLERDGNEWTLPANAEAHFFRVRLSE